MRSVPPGDFAMTFQPREWQKECMSRFREKIKEGSTSFVLEACMGAGKSALAAWIAKVLLEEHDLDHVIVLVPWRSIQGDAEKGMLGAFGKLLGLDARDRFFTLVRRQARQPRPRMEATITLYQEVCNQEAIETIKMWKADGFSFALICDEIHHTNEIDSSWGEYVEEIKNLASFSVFMSGTYFRSDKKPITCVPLDPDGLPVKDYRFTYSQGVKENVVRAVTTRDFNASVLFYDKNKDQKYEFTLNEIQNNKELSEAKKQVLDPHGECIRHMIETAHGAMLQTRTKFPDAACLFVCRPGGGDNYTRDGNEAQEDRHVHLIANQIRAITGATPTVVTHRDRDAIGKISAFRRGMDPYLVAVNMISEGCDIPRLRAVAFCRYTNSEMLFRQIVGRALRIHTPEDGTAAQIYLPSFPLLLRFAESLYSEAQEGIRDRRCRQCGEWPCECPCGDCGKHPCECNKFLFPIHEQVVMAIDAKPILDGGHVGAEHVKELFVGYAIRITEENDAHRHANHTQLGHALQRFMQMQKEAQQRPQSPASEPTVNPGLERDQMRRRINRMVRQLAKNVYNNDYAKAYHQEIEIPFRTTFKVIINTWSVDKLRQVDDRLERRMVEAFRHG
jgi:superfamily II DNA or RNA helicase